jgi:hypothetical protein
MYAKRNRDKTEALDTGVLRNVGFERRTYGIRIDTFTEGTGI